MAEEMSRFDAKAPFIRDQELLSDFDIGGFVVEIEECRAVPALHNFALHIAADILIIPVVSFQAELAWLRCLGKVLWSHVNGVVVVEVLVDHVSDLAREIIAYTFAEAEA